MKAARTIASISTTTSNGDSTSVNDASPKIWEISTSAGASTSAIWSGLFKITENAYDDWFLLASCTPTTFSIALPAIATTTSPAKVWLMESESMAGCSAFTNQSETKAAAVPAAASRPTASPSGQRGSSWGPASSSPDSRLRENGNDAANSRRSSTETITEKVTSCASAGVCSQWVNDGRAQAETDSSIRTTMVRARAEPSCWVPFLSPPTRKARPRTSSRLARIEPTRAARTTSTSPALSEKMQMNSSGRLPSADWSTPVAPGPKRSPSCSTERPTSDARRQTAAAETTKATTASQPPYSANPARTTNTTHSPSISLSDRIRVGVAAVALMGATVARTGPAF